MLFELVCCRGLRRSEGLVMLGTVWLVAGEVGTDCDYCEGRDDGVQER